MVCAVAKGVDKKGFAPTPFFHLRRCKYAKSYIGLDRMHSYTKRFRCSAWEDRGFMDRIVA